MFGKRSSFVTILQRRDYFEAYLEYLTNEEGCEEELQQLSEGRNKEEFTEYSRIWKQFRELVLQGEYDQAKEVISKSPFPRLMGKLEIKTVLADLAEKSGNFNAYEMFWKLFGEETVEAHDEALSFLNSNFPHAVESKTVAKDHLWWIVNNTKDKEQLKFAELGLDYFLKPDSFLIADDAAELILIARKINPKSKGAFKVEYELYNRDRALLAKIRPLLQEKLYDEAFEATGGAYDQQTRRVLVRGAHENKADAIDFIDALKELYRRTKEPICAYSAALSIWNSDVRRDSEELEWSMETALNVWDKLPHKDRTAAMILDALYLIAPYPLPDEKAKELAEFILSVDPENEIATESLAIAREQAEKEK